MGLNRAMDISVSGIEAQRLTMELIASNIANMTTTRTIDGGPYRRRIPIISEKMISFDDHLALANDRLEGDLGGVEVVDVVEDQTPFAKVYNPSHPDADSQGFVSMPNVNMSKEMIDLTLVSRLNEANITAFNASKKMMQDTLQLP